MEETQERVPSPAAQSESSPGEDQQPAPSDAAKPETSSQQQEKSAQKSEKVEILLNACGDAPIMKKKKWSVEDHRTIAWVSTFIRKFCKIPKSESLFLYVNQAFAPSPDECLKNLYNCFGSDNLLILHYSKSQAWG